MTKQKLLSNRSAIYALLQEHRAILIVMLLLFLERVFAIYFLGLQYSLHSDDQDYILSGIVFGNTGTVTMHNQISAQIMPGMPYFIGIVSILFGEGRLLLLVLRLLWAMMGTLSALYIYRCVRLFAPKWCAVLAAIPLFAPNYVWLDNLILTETPVILFTLAMIYHTMQMKSDGRSRHFWLTAMFYFFALLLKANAAIYPAFSAIYLLLKGYPFKRLLRQGLTLVGLLLIFLVPWSLRNYKVFHAFIPLTYGGGNPLLLGTAQGESARTLDDNDEEYYEYVETEFKARYGDSLNANGSLKEPEISRYYSLRKDELRASYRLNEWYQRSPRGMLHAFLVEKPSKMLYGIYYEKEIYGVSAARLSNLRVLSYLLAIISFILSFVLKKNRAELFFLALFYIANLYVYALYFSYSRYGQTLIPIWYIMIGIGFCLLTTTLQKAVPAVANDSHNQAPKA